VHVPEGSGCGRCETVLRKKVQRFPVDKVAVVGKEDSSPHKSVSNANRIVPGVGEPGSHESENCGREEVELGKYWRKVRTNFKVNRASRFNKAGWVRTTCEPTTLHDRSNKYLPNHDGHNPTTGGERGGRE